MKGNIGRRFEIATPIVLVRRKKKKKKQTKTVREMANVERHLTKAAAQTLEASASGLNRFHKRRNKARGKKPRRYALDFFPHALEASVVTSRKMTSVPVELLKAFYTRRTARLASRGMGSATRAVFRILRP